MVFERGYEASQPALKRASISKPYLVVEKVDMVEKICVKNPNKSNKKLLKHVPTMILKLPTKKFTIDEEVQDFKKSKNGIDRNTDCT